jgi:methyl-accepting chemotaxis protein
MPQSNNQISAINERLNFMDFNDAQRAALISMQPLIARSIEAALDKFYTKARAEPQTGRLFANEAHVAHAKERQAMHWQTIASARFDEQYVQAVTAIGRTHARLGLAPRWYMGGYALIIEELFNTVLRHELNSFFTRKKSDGLCQRIAAIMKGAIVDMDYSISTYLEALDAERLKSEQERESLQKAQNAAQEAISMALEELAKGDLTSRIDGELSPQFVALQKNYNDAVLRLRGVLSEVQSTMQSMTQGVSNMSSSTSAMATRTEQQAAALEEMASALDEITKIAGASSIRTKDAQQLAQTSAAEAQKSEETVKAAIASMTEIEESSRQITSIIGVIEEISFQTSLLALNAGVEAARAGEAGKGFAVVAQEVRALAERSAQAAKEIGALITKSSNEVSQGVSLVNATGDALQNIGGRIIEINSHINSITGAAQEQATGLNEITKAVQNLEQITQKNVAMMDVSNAATNALTEVSDRLSGLVQQFSLEREPAGYGGRGAARDNYPRAANYG